ncbi:Mitochondrial intermembrane space import and assembly protein 40 [Wickerhamomyces ciferrii]|uniref:Mitochondrial intermembrane space import and assembly protein 40 n=1 Tax=Wickerhamomyces ciferrii (strain ATCC 14091 / BCRC 22168 / CBS 111 / JCM 3599 / NBRC 0793 / NRRL Y-1031 F-60-10) TaxID=1206466 RepID=K0KGB7_WICCF|nr:Mitochondrial intermembrane space import and assembly protein 40 [Wickerhamomyces ciferrii]CCH40479.1 Mitochondrial intermembrane space import and assembly protein 40 [Wickerhamomyces ciferrii]
MFQRNIINSSLRLSRQGLRQNIRRNFNSSSFKSNNSNLSKWILSTSILTIGLTSYIQNPLKLETKQDKAPENAEKAAEKAAEKVIEKPKESESKESKSSEPKEGEDSDPESKQSAYNPETGEINWDCPCLGGMANGPCGEEFKEAFSCFVFSEADPKGVDCIEKFQNMQNCFRKYPEVYSAEIRDEEDIKEDGKEQVNESNVVANSSTSTESIPSADTNPTVTEQVTLTKE